MTQEREAVARLTEVASGFPAHNDRYGVGYVTVRQDDLKAILALRSGGERWRAEDGKVYVNVSGLTGTGKSAVYAELTIALQALGLTVEHADPAAWRGEMGLLSVGGNDLQDFKPTIVLTETNVPRAPSPSTHGEG